MSKKVAIFGSTGVTGKKIAQLIHEEQKSYTIHSLICKSNIAMLQKQIHAYSPKFVWVQDQSTHILFDNIATPEEIISDEEVDMVIFACDGLEMMKLAFLAAEREKDVAFASKDIFLVAGEVFIQLCKCKGVKVLSLDNELCGIKRCLEGEDKDCLEKIGLTASGGPFLRKDPPEMYCKKAYSHPTYICGEKASVLSAIYMNKGQELIAATALFETKIQDIEVVIHPQSIVQAMCSFSDGSIKASMADPDVSFAIASSLLNKNAPNSSRKLEFKDLSTLEFFSIDSTNFNSIDLCTYAATKGGSIPAYLHGASEELVEGFCEGRVSLKEMQTILERLVMNRSHDYDTSLAALVQASKEGRDHAREVVIV